MYKKNIIIIKLLIATVHTGYIIRINHETIINTFSKLCFVCVLVMTSSACAGSRQVYMKASERLRR